MLETGADKADDASQEHGGVLPQRPAALRAKAGDGSATLWWSTDDKGGGDDEDAYARTEAFVVYKYRLDGGEWKEKGDRIEALAPATSVTVTGLTNGKTYRFSVRARSRKGLCSAESVRSNSVVPYEPLPEPWQERFDAANQKTFYYNTETKQSTYVRPAQARYEAGEANSARFLARDIRRFRALFSELDTEEQGSVEHGALPELVAELGLPCSVSRSRLRHLTRQLDPEQSGRLEFDAFLTLVYRLQHPNLLEQLLDPKAAVEGAVGGVLAKLKPRAAEKARMERAHRRKMAEAERMGPWEEFFDEARRRKYYVHKVTKEKVWVLPEEVMFFVPEELRAFFTEPEQAEIRELFEYYDQDRSGEIDADELTEVLRALGDRSISHTQALKLVHEVDYDGSGQLCFGEFLQVLAMRKKSKMAFSLPHPLKALGIATEDTEFKAMQKQLSERSKEVKALQSRVGELERELNFLRQQKLVFVPRIPLQTFLADNNLLQYAPRLATFGARDTSDLFRLHDEDWTCEQLQFKLGHKRRCLLAMRKLERALDGAPRDNQPADSDDDDSCARTPHAAAQPTSSGPDPDCEHPESKQ
jgi:Ca2+-binding EF-hand superfamily protein